MRRFTVVLGLTLAGVSCGLPSDVSDEFAIEMATSDVILTLGDTVRLFPTVTRNGASVTNIPVTFVSADPTVALVDREGLVRGLGTGSAEITASPAGMAGATPASRLVRVLSAVSIDTVVATSSASADGRTVAWGEVIEIHGVGLDPTFGNLVFVGDRPARLSSFVAANPNNPDAFDVLSVWVPVGAAATSDVLVSRLGGSTATWTVNVLQQDVLERDDRVRLDAADNVFVPDLALEIAPDMENRRCLVLVGGIDPSACFADGYELVAPPSGEMTLTIEMDQPIATFPGRFEINSDSLGGSQPQVWRWSPEETLCVDFRNITNLFPETRHRSRSQSGVLTLPMRLAPSQRVHLHMAAITEEMWWQPWVTPASETLRYSLSLREGYHGDLPPDAAEGNDNCLQTEPIDALLDQRQLNFDTGWDLDWFDFRQPGAPEPSPNLLTESEPNDRLITPDTVQYGTLTSASIRTFDDLDYFTFFANANDLFQVEVITAQETGAVSLDAFMQLYFDGQPIAFQDDRSETDSDPSIIHRAQNTGWYTVSVQDLHEDVSFIQDYQLSVRRVSTNDRRLTVIVSSPQFLPPGQFTPRILLMRNGLDSPDAGPVLIGEGVGVLEQIITPDEYFLMIFNQVGVPAEYTLDVRTDPVG